MGGRNDEPQDVSAIDTSAAGANILNPMVRPGCSLQPTAVLHIVIHATLLVSERSFAYVGGLPEVGVCCCASKASWLAAHYATSLLHSASRAVHYAKHVPIRHAVII